MTLIWTRCCPLPVLTPHYLPRYCTWAAFTYSWVTATITVTPCAVPCSTYHVIRTVTLRMPVPQLPGTPPPVTHGTAPATAVTPPHTLQHGSALSAWLTGWHAYLVQTSAFDYDYLIGQLLLHPRLPRSPADYPLARTDLPRCAGPQLPVTDGMITYTAGGHCPTGVDCYSCAA